MQRSAWTSRLVARHGDVEQCLAWRVIVCGGCGGGGDSVDGDDDRDNNDNDNDNDDDDDG